MNRKNWIDLIVSFLIIVTVILLVALTADILSLAKGTISWNDTLLALPKFWVYAAVIGAIFAPLGAWINHEERQASQYWLEGDQR